MMRCYKSTLAVVALAILSVGCSKDFTGERVKSAVEAQPMTLDGEQVTLTGAQVDCGVEADLWDKPSQASGGRMTARLSQKGRDLKFNDDVVYQDPNYRQPYVQVRGEVSLQVDEVPAIRDGENGTKIGETKVGVKIQHACFQNPLPLMGIKKGNFNPDTPVIFQFHQSEDGNWKVDKLLH
jgi:hypothetical protein